MKTAIVPEEPTRDQITAAFPLLPDLPDNRAKRLCAEIYRAMIQTAPAAKRGGLTRQQLNVQQIIADHIDAHGEPPTYEEIGEVLKRKRSDVFRIVVALERKKILERTGGKRSINLLVRPGEKIPTAKEKGK